MATERGRTTHPAAAADADRVLLERVIGLDDHALAELYDRHSRLLFGLVLRIVGQRGEAEELLQEVFFTVWQKAATYNQALGSPAGWMVGIARHRALDHLRSRAVRTRTLEAAPHEGAPVATPEHQAASGEQRRDVAQALEMLPPEQRLLIEEAYFLGLSQSELADRHQMPLGTVKTRIRAGMLALRQQLAQSYAQQ